VGRFVGRRRRDLVGVLDLVVAEIVTPVSLALDASSTMKAIGWPTSTTLPTSAIGPER